MKGTELECVPVRGRNVGNTVSKKMLKGNLSCSCVLTDLST